MKTVDTSNATPALVGQVEAVLKQADQHTYSVAGVYAAYNAAFEKNDSPQSCSSCLRNRVKELRGWYRGWHERQAENLAYAGDVVTTHFETVGTDVLNIVFTPGKDDPFKGTVKHVDGSNVKPGKYSTVDGYDIAVQPGGKATLSETPTTVPTDLL